MTALNITREVDGCLARTVAATSSLKARTRSWRVVSRLFEGVDFLARGVFHVWRNRRYLSPIKLANMALVNIQFHFKSEYVVGRPYRMKIESTNICNTQCQLCPTGIGLEGRPKGKMTFEQYAGLVDQLKTTLVALDLSMWGDPLIVPDIFEMIRYAHDRRIWTYISSNLHAFKIKPPRGGGKDQATRLVESGLDLMTCSLHGATQATYEIYQPGKRLDESIEKIKHIMATRDRIGSKTPDIQLNFVVTKFNEHERGDFKKLAESLGCRAVFSWAALNTRFLNKDQKLQPLGLADDVLKKKTRDHIDKWLPTQGGDRLEIYREMHERGELNGEDYNGKKAFGCSWPWRQSVINWDGQVVTCCGSFEQWEDMGNVFEQPFSRVWNSRKYRMARRSFKKKVEGADAKDNPCATCPGVML
ncbi:MAG: hypothetical protein GC164_00650 [Phycisphaera sp.]|nr:hypothetical protein [Phycisphaera sp.]